MVRLIAFLVSVAALAFGLSWLADQPGTVRIDWQGYEIDTSVFRATVIAASALVAGIFIWTVLRTIWNSPAAFGAHLTRRRQRRGLDAISSGMIAVGAGDKVLASQYALQARKSLPHEPLTHVLRAQAAQLAGDRSTARRIYEGMLVSPETEQLGLRGLYLEAEREGEGEAALQFAERAQKANPRLGWSSAALFETKCKQKDWAGALEVLDQAKRGGHTDKAAWSRKRAVLLTGLAQDLEDSQPDKALAYASEAHGLAPDLIPAAAVAGRILASRGNTGKAAKIIQKTWGLAPHPDLALAYAHARTGDSVRDRMDRMHQLSTLNPASIESAIAVATTAIDSRLYEEAREALRPLLHNRLSQRVAILMARIEGSETGDKGRVREWLARAANAARDPVWMADGVISDRWEPVSPVDGRLDAFDWRVPTDARDSATVALESHRFEELLAIGTREPKAAAASDIADPVEDDIVPPGSKRGGTAALTDVSELQELVPAEVPTQPRPATGTVEMADATEPSPENDTRDAAEAARPDPGSADEADGRSHSGETKKSESYLQITPKIIINRANGSNRAHENEPDGEAHAAAPARDEQSEIESQEDVPYSRPTLRRIH